MTCSRMREAHARAFKTIVREAGFSDADLAQLLGISRASVTRRLNGHAPIKAYELLMVMDRADDFDEVNRRFWDLVQGFSDYGVESAISEV